MWWPVGKKEKTAMSGPATVLLRFIVRDHVSKDESLGKAIQELAKLDALVHEIMIFISTNEGWKAAA